MIFPAPPAPVRAPNPVGRAEGLSNAGIARRLVVTDGAIEKHVTSIFAKLRLEPAETDHRRVLAVLRHLEER